MLSDTEEDNRCLRSSDTTEASSRRNELTAESNVRRDSTPTLRVAIHFRDDDRTKICTVLEGTSLRLSGLT